MRHPLITPRYIEIPTLDDIDTKLEQTIANFYKNLVENQESLGPEFERVLHENLWDLYE